MRAWIELDGEALAGNVAALRGLLGPGRELLAVVKANAYGHGLIEIGSLLAARGIAWFGVSTIEEGIQLRHARVPGRILVLGGFWSQAEVLAALDLRLDLSISTPEQLELVRAAARVRGNAPAIHLKIDTGLSRLGALPGEAAALARRLSEAPALPIASVWSHLACADAPEPEATERQRAKFAETVAQLPLPAPPRLHLANSAGLLRGDERLRLDMARVGLALYGLAPAPWLRDRCPLTPVLSLKARVAQVKELPPGTAVSYGARFVTARPARVAVVSAGYGDGIPRRLSGRMAALVRGQRAPQVGAITMDLLMLDVTAIPGVVAGDDVTLLGPRLPAEEWAELDGTIPYEILCGMANRLPRVITGTVPSQLAPTPQSPGYPPPVPVVRG